MPQTGATRYQKFLKSEKAKTKLKSKKDLPKGTNVTKTNFKVKKIVIKEQLKAHSQTEALTTRKLNLKETLLRLKHHNSKTQTESLRGLSELITSHPLLLEQSLLSLVSEVTPLVLSYEPPVRHECLKLLQLIISQANNERIEPFFDIMCTYLRSAMTHIDNRIQQDSLLFLDILLLGTPANMVQDFHKIIPNFLDMISKLRVDSKPGRTLTVNLESKITSVKWRVKVLHHLQDYLNKFVKYNSIADYTEHSNTTTKTYDSNGDNYFSLFNSNYVQTCQVSCFSSKNMQDSVPFDEAEKFMSYVNILIPLLFETWLEVSPSKNSDKKIETVVSEDAANLLQHTLEVIELIWCLTKYFNAKCPRSNSQQMFSQQYRHMFLQHFVNSFPFVTNVRSRQQSVDSQITDPKLVAQNLKICKLYIVLNPSIKVNKENKDIMSVLTYIEKTFNSNTQDNINDVIMEILHTIFSDKFKNWAKCLHSLFENIIWVYFNKDMSSSLRQKIFNLLCKIVLNDKLLHFSECNAYKSWLNSLPNILLEKEVTTQTIDTIHKFAVRSNSTFNVVIKPKLILILENLPNVKVTDADIFTYYKLFSLLYYVKVWDKESLDLLEKQLLENAYKCDYGNYIFDTMRLSTGGIL